MTTIATVKLPCKVSELEAILHRAAHAAHWHDAQLVKGTDADTVCVAYPSEDEK